MASKKDPTISTSSVDKTAYPEGTHPALPPSEVTFSPDRFDYRDATADEKPDPSTVMQVQVLPEDK